MNYKKDGIRRTEFVVGDLDPAGAGQLADAMRLGIRKSALEKLAQKSKLNETDQDMTVAFLMALSQGKGYDMGDHMVRFGDLFEVQSSTELTKLETEELKIVGAAIAKCF